MSRFTSNFDSRGVRSSGFPLGRPATAVDHYYAHTRKDNDMSDRVLDQVVAMADQLRDQADEAERIGRLTDDTVKLMKGAGLIRLLQTK